MIALISDEVRERLKKEGIEEDALRLILSNEKSRAVGFLDEEDETKFVSGLIGSITLWVRYREEQDAIRILDAYYHRIRIKGVGER